MMDLNLLLWKKEKQGRFITFNINFLDKLCNNFTNSNEPSLKLLRNGVTRMKGIFKK